jgi:hypothetical protein
MALKFSQILHCRKSTLWYAKVASYSDDKTGREKKYSLISLNTTVTSWHVAGTAWLTAKHYKVSPLWVEYHSIKTIK